MSYQMAMVVSYLYIFNIMDRFIVLFIYVFMYMFIYYLLF